MFSISYLLAKRQARKGYNGRLAAPFEDMEPIDS
jgi:hypothetical protein